MKTNRPLGLTVEQAAEAHDNTLFVHEGIIFPRVLLPYFLPHLTTIDHETGIEKYIGPSLTTSIQYANPIQIQTYVSAHTNL